MPDLSALVLAGGKSSRMGRDKSLIPIHGTPLIELIVQQLRPWFAEVIICADRKERFAHLGCRVIRDETPGLGPLMGIVSGLKGARTELNFVLACDIPRIDPPFIRRMIQAASGFDILLPRHPDGRYEPLLGIYSKRIVPIAEAMIDRGIRKIDRIYPACRLGFLDFNEFAWLKNINTMEEYNAYVKNIAGRS